MDDARFEALIERMDRRADVRDQRFLDRMSRSEQHFIDALAENTAEIKRLGDGMRESLTKMRESLADLRESIQANTQAVFSVLDRMDRFEGGTS